MGDPPFLYLSIRDEGWSGVQNLMENSPFFNSSLEFKQNIFGVVTKFGSQNIFWDTNLFKNVFLDLRIIMRKYLIRQNLLTVMNLPNMNVGVSCEADK